jgi:hypothetical protein
MPLLAVGLELDVLEQGLAQTAQLRLVFPEAASEWRVIVYRRPGHSQLPLGASLEAIGRALRQ